MKRIVSLVLAIILLGGCTAMADFSEEAWYAEALQKCEVSLGNNLRLKNVIERAQAGEQITIATVGGSITEGALAAKYDECWAKRFAAQFGETYGTDGGANVTLVNSGVGGTPSTFGYMRYGREILGRVPEGDPDGLPDLVVIEYAVNDWGEPTGYRCYESMVKEILSQPNNPAVILLFSVRNDGWNMQGDHQKIGECYDLPMVSLKGIYSYLDKEYPKKNYFADEYHPNSTGHGMMADALMQAVKDAAAAETAAADIDLDVKPAFGTDFMGLKTIYGDTKTDEFTVERNSFDKKDLKAYRNTPVGVVCGELNFCHGKSSEGLEPLRITGVFSKCVIAWLASADSAYGAAEIYVDGKLKTTLCGGGGKWGQSEAVLVLDGKEPAEHTVEIRATEEGKKFTVTAISVK